MKSNDYAIEVPKLALGQHEFDFVLDTLFFEHHPDIQSANVKVHLDLDRTNRHIIVDFFFDGTIDLNCDRCLNQYHYKFIESCKMVYSFEKSLKETEDEEVVYIPRGIYLLDFTQDMYDLVALKIPFRKVPEDCPRPECPPELISMLENTQQLSEESLGSSWEILKNLKIDNSNN